MWLLYAVGSSFFAGITSILAKCGIKKQIQMWQLPSDSCSVVIFLDDGFDHRKRERNYVDQWKNDVVSCSLRACNRRFLALLLQSFTGRTCQCGSTGR